MSHYEPLSQAVSLRRDVIQRAVHIFRGWSYRDIEVPLLDTFEPGESAGTLQQTLQVIDKDGNLRVLRADVTPAVARLYARQLYKDSKVLRACYANRVVRAQRAFGRDQSESYQIGIELIGRAGISAELEVILICMETLSAIGADRCQVNLGSVAVMGRLLEMTGLPKVRLRDIHAAAEARDPFEVRDILHRSGTRSNIAEALEAIASLNSGQVQIEAIKRAVPNDTALNLAFGRLDSLTSALTELGFGDRLNIDLGDLQGPAYYSGTIFKVVSERIGRALGGGGRYDGLCGRFGVEAPAVGFSLHLDALIEVLQPDASARVSAPAGSAVRVDPNNPLPGLREALARRKGDQPTLVVESSGGAPDPHRRSAHDRQ